MANHSKAHSMDPHVGNRTRPTALASREGEHDHEPDIELELLLAGATYIVDADTYHECVDGREERFVQLVHRAVATRPGFVAGLAPYLRQELGVRSASIVLAAEYVAAGGERGRGVVDAVLQRGDEPAEMIGYWHSRHGRKLPMAVKRGVADAAVRLYNERAALRYNGTSRGVRMADVIELTHPRARDARQSALFKWLLDRRHHADAVADPDVLPALAAAGELATVLASDSGD